MSFTCCMNTTHLLQTVSHPLVSCLATALRFHASILECSKTLAVIVDFHCTLYDERNNVLGIMGITRVRSKHWIFKPPPQRTVKSAPWLARDCVVLGEYKYLRFNSWLEPDKRCRKIAWVTREKNRLLLGVLFSSYRTKEKELIQFFNEEDCMIFCWNIGSLFHVTYDPYR